MSNELPASSAHAAVHGQTDFGSLEKIRRRGANSLFTHRARIVIVLLALLAALGCAQGNGTAKRQADMVVISWCDDVPDERPPMPRPDHDHLVCATCVHQRDENARMLSVHIQLDMTGKERNYSHNKEFDAFHPGH